MRTRKTLLRLLAAGFGLTFGILGAEATFGHLRAPAAAPLPAVLYSIELRNGQGDLVANPMVVGQEGRHVHLDLSQEGPHSEPLAMSLDLDPRPFEAGICMGFDLSVDDGRSAHGRIGLQYGLEGSYVPLSGGGQLWLRAARAHTAEFEQLIARRIYRPAA